MPEDIAVTNPDALIVAIAGEALDQILVAAGAVALESCVVAPAHKVRFPVIA